MTWKREYCHSTVRASSWNRRCGGTWTGGRPGRTSWSGFSSFFLSFVNLETTLFKPSLVFLRRAAAPVPENQRSEREIGSEDFFQYS